jgi:hypothetical protein
MPVRLRVIIGAFGSTFPQVSSLYDRYITLIAQHERFEASHHHKPLVVRTVIHQNELRRGAQRPPHRP